MTTETTPTTESKTFRVRFGQEINLDDLWSATFEIKQRGDSVGDTASNLEAWHDIASQLSRRDDETDMEMTLAATTLQEITVMLKNDRLAPRVAMNIAEASVRHVAINAQS